MSVFAERAELLEQLEFKWGRSRGRLAAAMDILSDLSVALGTHNAYCQAARQSPRASQDLLDALRGIGHVKELLASLIDARESAASTQSG